MNYVLERYMSYSEPAGWAYNDGGWAATTSVSLWAGAIATSTGNESGLRFRKVYLPADAVIGKAVLKFRALNYYDTVPDHVDTRIYVQDAIDAATFVGEDYASYIARPRLAGYAEQEISTWVTDNYYDSADFKTQIQALVDNYGALDDADIVVFWGDIDERSPAGNYLVSDTRWSYLRVEFTSNVVLPVPHNSVLYSLDDIVNMRYKLEDDIIANDARVLVPHSSERPDYSVEPPVMIPVDYAWLQQDQDSIYKYGRRTRLSYFSGTDVAFWGASLCERQVTKYKDVIPTMAARTTPTTDAEMAKHLSTRISDKFTVDNDAMGMYRKFWVDSKVMTIGANVDIDYGLTEIRATNVPGVFEVDIDHIGDTEELIG